jgi:hypothetical protein
MLKSWTIRNYDVYFNSIGGPSRAYSWPIFEYFGEGINCFEKAEIQAAITSFLLSDDYFLSRKHFPRYNVKFIPLNSGELSIFDKWDL